MIYSPPDEDQHLYLHMFLFGFFLGCCWCLIFLDRPYSLSSSSLLFLWASSIIQHWQLLLSSGSSDPGMLWPGSRLPLAPWASRRVQPRPSLAYNSLCGCCCISSVSSGGYKDSGSALGVQQPDLLFRKTVFSLSKSISVTRFNLHLNLLRDIQGGGQNNKRF